MIVLFWDIDGTLLTTGRAGMYAWVDACLELTGHVLEIDAVKTDGLTDHQVAVKICDHVSRRAPDELLQRMVKSYEQRLAERLHLRKGRVLTGVREVLVYLRSNRPDVRSMLLTGNTASGALAKLTHYGLDEFFQGGAFSQDREARSAIAHRALRAARESCPGAVIRSRDVFVIGDTPHDVACAHAIGARSIAVATGVYSVSELQDHNPWRALEQVPDPATFEALIDPSRGGHRSPRH